MLKISHGGICAIKKLLFKIKLYFNCAKLSVCLECIFNRDSPKTVVREKLYFAVIFLCGYKILCKKPSQMMPCLFINWAFSAVKEMQLKCLTSGRCSAFWIMNLFFGRTDLRWGARSASQYLEFQLFVPFRCYQTYRCRGRLFKHTMKAGSPKGVSVGGFIFLSFVTFSTCFLPLYNILMLQTGNSSQFYSFMPFVLW